MGTQARLLFTLPEPVYDGAFSPEGDQLAVFGPDRIVRIWDVRHRLELRKLRGHLSSITQVAYAGDGRLLASASRDGVVKIWERQHHGRVLCEETIATSSGISPDGKWIATPTRGWHGASWMMPALGRLQWQRPSRTQKLIISSAFSPDSRLLYTAGSDRCVRIYNVL